MLKRENKRVNQRESPKIRVAPRVKVKVRMKRVKGNHPSHLRELQLRMTNAFTAAAMAISSVTAGSFMESQTPRR